MEEIEQCGYQIDKCPGALQLNAKAAALKRQLHQQQQQN